MILMVPESTSREIRIGVALKRYARTRGLHRMARLHGLERCHTSRSPGLWGVGIDGKVVLRQGARANVMRGFGYKRIVRIRGMRRYRPSAVQPIQVPVSVKP